MASSRQRGDNEDGRHTSLAQNGQKIYSLTRFVKHLMRREKASRTTERLLFFSQGLTCVSLLISPPTEVNCETKWRYTEFPTDAAGFCREKEAWPLFLNEWKWPTLWACVNLNWVAKGILCNSVLFDLETAPLLIRGRTGDGCAHRASWGECYNGRPLQQPVCSQTQHQTSEATQMQLGAGGADNRTCAHMHTRAMAATEEIVLAKHSIQLLLLPMAHLGKGWEKALSVSRKHTTFPSEGVTLNLGHNASSVVMEV